MAEHEHTRTIHLYHIELPFGLTPQQVEFESAQGVDMLQILEELAEYSDDELKRVIAGAAALLAKYPHRSPGGALHTAMVWERG